MEPVQLINLARKELSILMETSGIQRALRCVNIAQILDRLEEAVSKPQLAKVEENQNGI